MNKLFPLSLLLATGMAMFAVPAFSATQTWNPGGAGGGTGNWSGNNWDSAAPWVNGNIALFGGTAGTVTASTQTVGGITFNTSGYTISSGTLTLTPASSPFVFTTATNGGTDTISSTLNSAAGASFTKTGAGTLVLTGTLGSGTVATPNFLTITGGTYSSSTGVFSSIVSAPYGSFIGTQPTNVTVQYILDAGTLKFTGTGSLALAANRTVQINNAGGAITDAGGDSYSPLMVDNAGAASSLYLSNAASTTSTYNGVISGGGSVTWNGAGIGALQGANTYTGATIASKGTLQLSAVVANATVITGKAQQITTTLGSGTSLVNNAITIASGATLRLQYADLPYTLPASPAQVAAQPGTVVTSGVNNIRLATGSSLSPGTYTLFAASTFTLGTGSSFEMDGGSTLTVPALSLIKQVGSTYYRLTLQTAATAEQVVVSAAPANVINEMPLGSSITEGVSGQGSSYTGGGYRSQLYQMLVNDGRFTPNFVGSNTVLDNNSGSGYNVLTGANQLHHEGHGGYTTSQILTNLNAGGYWLATDPSKTGYGVNPDYVTLSIGGNDYGNSATDTQGPVDRTDAIITSIQTLRPASHVIAASLFYRTQTSGGQIVGDLQNTYYNPKIPAVVFNHVLAGHHVSFNDTLNAVTPYNGTTYDTSNISSDGIHPLTSGYDIFATTWYNELAFGVAYWTGSQNGSWNTVTAGNATNFAQNYQLTTPRQTALDAATDVYFNKNSAALPTVLGQDIAVRGVNFAVGATGPVTIAGNNTLTLGTGGLTVQAGTGAHTISANVALGAAQTWGNVSSNPFTVGGAISGNFGLALTGSYAIQVQVSPTSNATSTQSYTGTGSFVLSGANTYTGGTTVSGLTLVVSNASGSGTGSGSVTIASGATLTDNGAISGNLNLGGTANGSGVFGGAVAIASGAVFNATGTVGGTLNVAAGGLVMLSGGTLNANGGVVNNGTVRLERGAALVVGNGTSFVNNGTLDVITGGFSAPGGFTNNGVVIDSSVIKVNSASLANGAFTVTVDGYTSHNYQLQRSSSLTDDVFTNVGTAQSGTTGVALTFTDASPTSTQGFYRVQVDPDTGSTPAALSHPKNVKIVAPRIGGGR